MNGRVFIRTPALVAILVLALVAPVSAQTGPTTDAYGGQQGEVLGNFQTGGNDVVPPPAVDDVVPPPAGGEAPRVTPPRPTERGVDAPVPVTPSVTTGELPFTGFEAGLVALAGLALLGTGFAIRRVSRNDG